MVISISQLGSKIPRECHVELHIMSPNTHRLTEMLKNLDLLRRKYLIFTGDMGSMLDYRGRGLTRIEAIQGVSPQILLYDRNSISKIENLDKCKQLQKVGFSF